MDSYKDDHVAFEFVDEILVATFLKKEIDLDAAKYLVKKRYEFIGENKFMTMIDFHQVKFTSKEARSYFSGERSTKNILAMAVLVRSILQRTVSSFFIKLNKPKYPVKIFVDKNDAINWLRSFHYITNEN